MTLITNQAEAPCLPDTQDHPLVRMGAQVRKERERHRGKLRELAMWMDLEESDIHDIEDGKRLLAPDQWVRLAQWFDLDVEHFVTPFRLIDNEVLAWSKEGPSTLFPLAQGVPLGSRLSLFQWLRSKTHIGRGFPHPLFGRHLRLPAHPSDGDVERLADRLHAAWRLDGQLQSLQDAMQQELHVQVLWLDEALQTQGQEVVGVLARLDREDVLVLRPIADLRRLADVMAQALFHLTTSGSLAWWKPQTRLQGSLFAQRFVLGTHPVALPTEACEGNAFGSPLFARMLHEALDDGFLSARKAAQLMHMSLDELGPAFERLGMENPIGF